jgi:hypothetical protein
MAIYSANRPNKTVTIHKSDCRVIPRGKLEPCGCGDAGELGNQHWYCEKHICRDAVDKFMNGRFWAILLCELCFREALEIRIEKPAIILEALNQQFHQEMLRVAKFANQFNIGIRFLKMVEQNGGLATAKQLLAKAGPQQGLIRLKEVGHLDKCMEAVVLQDKFCSLFTEDELAEAHRRLEGLKYFK